MIAGPAAAFAADTAEAIVALDPDALVADAFVFGSMIAAEAAVLPTAVVLPSIWMIPARGTPPMGPGFAPAQGALGRGRDAVMVATVNRLFSRGLPALNAARAGHGLAPLTSLYDQALAAERILVLSSPAFDYASASVPGNVRYVGPVLDDPDWAEPWRSPWPASDTRPLVLVGFSSTYQDQGPVLRRVVQALSSLPVRAVVTVGRMLGGGEVSSTADVRVVPSAPHAPILAGASLVVSHCGHGTTLKALAAGVPMVCIPMGRDQNDVAARVVHHGAGVRLPPRASAARVRRAVERVLATDRYREGAARMAATIAAERAQRAEDALVAELEAVADGAARSH